MTVLWVEYKSLAVLSIEERICGSALEALDECMQVCHCSLFDVRSIDKLGREATVGGIEYFIFSRSLRVYRTRKYI
jgi:hypothetical protein